MKAGDGGTAVGSAGVGSQWERQKASVQVLQMRGVGAKPMYCSLDGEAAPSVEPCGPENNFVVLAAVPAFWPSLSVSASRGPWLQ